MSPEKHPSKRFKQSTIAEYFSSPKSRQNAAKQLDLMKEQRASDESVANLEREPSVLDRVRAGENPPASTSGPSETGRQRQSVLQPSSSDSTVISSFSSSSTKSENAQSKIPPPNEIDTLSQQPEQAAANLTNTADEAAVSGGSGGGAAAVPRCSTNVATPTGKNYPASKCSSSDKKLCAEPAEGLPRSFVHNVQPADVPATDGYSTDSDGSCCEIRIFPLDLEQEAGTMPEELIRFPRDALWRPGDLESCADHTLLIQTPQTTYDDVWDQYHVKMPNSAYSLYTDTNGAQISRWELIEKALRAPIHSFYDLRDAIMSYNGGFDWDMEELEDLLELMSRDERVSFFEQLLPAIIGLALKMPHVFPMPPPLLTKGRSQSLTMSQVQASCLLANAFLSTFPRRNSTKPTSQFHNYPSINFHTLFNRCYQAKRRSCRKEKIRCILNYFRRVTEKAPDGNITFTRLRLRCAVGWESSQARFQRTFVTSEGLIEDQGYGMLMVDFANRKVGGGVLRDGCVQEEILFVLYPELICSRLFTEALEDDEALLITGVERFNQSEGFSDEFKWKGNVSDFAQRDPWGRKYTQIVAIDALAHEGKRQQRQQFATEKLLRELVKAFCGFQTPGFPRSCVATGNWGCGAFGGDPRLKFLLQWMAASRAGRQLTYFTFGNHELMCELRALQGLIVEHDIRVGDLFILLKAYNRQCVSAETSKDSPSLSEFIFQNLGVSDAR